MDAYVQQRLSYDGHLCTVRFVGQVQSTKGDWLGVEWDESDRGKHNGEHGGVRYFECQSKSPTAGSFVRPTRPYDERKALVEALKSKYASESTAGDNDELVRISGKDVEEVGFERIRQQQAELRNLRVILLDGMCIGRKDRAESPASVADGVAETCPSCEELDISRNLFEDWSEILEILAQLPKLKRLVLDGNRFRISPIDRTAVLNRGLPQVTSLSLNECRIGCLDIVTFCSLLPQVVELSAAGNSLKNFSFPGRLLRYIFCLRSLILDDNNIDTFADIRDLAGIPTLQHISLKRNKLANVSGKDSYGLVLAYPEILSELDLSANRISDWASINGIAIVFPGLTALRLTSNPLYSFVDVAGHTALDAEDDAFMLTLARIKGLTTLNHSKITDKERLNAETYYLSQIGKELSSVSEQQRHLVLKEHPRYAELCTQYGEPAVLRKDPSGIDPDSFAARLIQCKIRLGASLNPSIQENGDPLSLDLAIPRSFTIYNVLGLLGKRFGLEPMSIELIWETGEAVLSAIDNDSDEDEKNAVLPPTRTGRNSQPLFREERLKPLTRHLGTWLEQPEATLRIEIIASKG